MINLAEALKRIWIAEGWWLPEPNDPWRAIYDRCESPIERLMCIGIRDLLGYEANAGHFNRPVPSERRAGALVFAQQQINRYRADFLVVGFLRGEAPIRIVVECDGREFHDHIADQERDFDLSSWGFKVVRFTGREITRDLPRVINRIPRAMGERYAYWIAAELGRVEMPDVVDQFERKAMARSALDEDGFYGNWDDTL